jgi:acyl-CoA dehydrogenase
MNAHDTPERTLLRDQVARFVQRDIEPNGDAWERAGSVPRHTLKQMGSSAGSG